MDITLTKWTRWSLKEHSTLHFIVGACIRPYRNATLIYTLSKAKQFPGGMLLLLAMLQLLMMMRFCMNTALNMCVCYCRVIVHVITCNYLLRIFRSSIARSLPSRGYACLSSQNALRLTRNVLLNQLA